MPPRGASNEKHDEPEDSLAAHWGSFLRAARCSCRWPLASACSLCRWVTAPGPTREALVARLLRQTSDQGIAVLDGVAHLPADDQVVRAMDVLTRLSATDDAAAMATARMLAAHHSELVRRAEGQATRRSGPPKERDGPPVDISAKGIQILHDEDQRTAVVIQLFETADDMAAAEGPLDTMDPGDTPGTRASIDRCEIKAELSPS